MRTNQLRRLSATVALVAIAACSSTPDDTTRQATYEASAAAEARGQAADSARLQAQADAYEAAREAEARGQAADSARLQAQADAYEVAREAEARGQAADSARLQAQADAYEAGRPGPSVTAS